MMLLWKILSRRVSSSVTFLSLRVWGHVGLALDGDGLAGQHLDAVVRAVEEDTAAGNHAELEELFRVLHWVLEQLPLPDCWVCGIAHGVVEVLHCDGEAEQGNIG